MTRFLYTVKLAWRSLLMHKLRSGLTILGIVFGVASVITMIAVGEGTSQSAQASIRKLGTMNIIITSIKKSEEVTQGYAPVEYGVTKEDVVRIRSSIPEIKKISLQRKYENPVHHQGNSKQATIYATDPFYFTIKKLDLIKGRKLCGLDDEEMKTVCVVSKSLAQDLFLFHDPLTMKLKFQGVFFDVVGVSDESEPIVYIPFKTSLKRFGDVVINRANSSYSSERVDYHQVIITRRRHRDYEHHARLSIRKNQRNRTTQSLRRKTTRHRHSISHRIHLTISTRWIHRCPLRHNYAKSHLQYVSDRNSHDSLIHHLSIHNISSHRCCLW